MEAQIETLDALDPTERIRWAVDQFTPRSGGSDSLIASTSFGVDSAALLHMLSLAAPELPIVFIDTGYHFPETLAYKDQLAGQLDLDIRVFRPLDSKDRFQAKYGRRYDTDPDFCCRVNKVEPMQRALQGVDCWITGRRWDQGQSRREVPIFEDDLAGLYKVNPIADWDHQQISAYIQRHGLPEHPLAARGYTSVGCEPCTVPPLNPEDRRSGRWFSFAKTECGIHQLDGGDRMSPGSMEAPALGPSPAAVDGEASGGAE